MGPHVCRKHAHHPPRQPRVFRPLCNTARTHPALPHHLGGPCRPLCHPPWSLCLPDQRRAGGRARVPVPQPTIAPPRASHRWDQLSPPPPPPPPPSAATRPSRPTEEQPHPRSTWADPSPVSAAHLSPASAAPLPHPQPTTPSPLLPQAPSQALPETSS